MHRDVGALADREFDLLVVGGGVYGAATAWDAALRGLSVALVEKGDFGSGTSFNNLKTVHGGIRYLQHGDFRRMRESVRERRALLRIAPHLVHPLRFLVPTYRGPVTSSRAALRTAILLNDLVSWDRNRGAARQRELPAGEALRVEDVLALAPDLERDGLTGGVVWYDAQMHNSDRVTLSFVLSAVEAGAVPANFVRAEGLLRDGERVIGAKARDVLSGDELDIRARTVVNASGPWVDALFPSRRRLFHFSKAMNLVTRPVVRDVALGVRSRRPHVDDDSVLDASGRFLCLVPWRGVTLVGTSHAPHHGGPDELEATEADIRDLLDDVNDAYPAAELVRSDVRLVHRGLLPASPGANGAVTLEKRYRIEDHEAEGAPGLLSIVGVKYTTARDVAEKAVDRAVERLEGRARPSDSSRRPLAGGDLDDVDALVREVATESGLDDELAEHLARTYGTRYREVLAAGRATRLCPSSPVLEAEVRHAVREEMALDLESVVLRRTELGTAGRPSSAAVSACADILVEELGWSGAKRQEEIDSLERFYDQRS